MEIIKSGIAYKIYETDYSDYGQSESLSSPKLEWPPKYAGMNSSGLNRKQKMILLDPNPNKCYYSTERKSDDMSFVGMSFFRDHIIAFADTKSSVVLPDGTTACDANRGIVHKLYATDNFVLAMYSTNVVAYNEKQRIVNEPVEDVVKKIEPKRNPKELVLGFMEYLRKVQAAGITNPYGMMFGYKSDFSLVYENYTILPTEYSLISRLQTETVAEFSGDADYCNFYNFSRANLVVDDEEAIRKELERTILYRNSVGWKYNSVGTPVDVLTWIPR